MKKLFYILLLIPAFAFSQGKIRSDQINTSPFAVSDSLYVNVKTKATTISGATLVGLGTSIMAGTGINTGGIYGSSGGIRWFTQLATLLGFTENNLAVSGSTVELQSGYTPSSSFINARTSVPTYGSLVAGSILVIETGPNDWAIGCTNYNTTNYPTDLGSTLTYVKGTKGWPAAQILVLNNSYVNPALYGTAGSGCSGTITSANYLLFQAATLAQATAAGVKYFDVNAWVSNHGGISLLADNLHLNNYGHTTEANGVYTFLRPALVTQAAQAGIATNGLDVANAKLENLNVLNNSSPLLALSSSGILGITQSIPGGTLWDGNAIFNGLIYQQGAAYTFTPSTNHDIILKQPLIYDISASGLYTKTNLCTAVVGFNFTTNYNSSGDTLASFSGPVGKAFSVLQSGKTNILDSYYVVAGTNTGLKATAAGATTGLYPFTTASGTQMFSDYEIGFLQFSTAPVSRGTLAEAARFAASGHLLIGGTTDATYRLDVFNTAARFQNGIGVGIINPALTFSTLTTSTTGGTLAAATYYYKIVPVDFFNNEGTASVELFVTTTGSTSSNNLGWTAVTNAASYHVYQGTVSNTEGKYFTSATNSATDIGSGYTTKALPTTNSTYLGQISSTGAGSFTGANISNLTATKVVFTDASKNLTSTGIGTSSQYIAGDGSLSTIGSKPHTIFTPTTGGTVALTNNQYNIINPAGALLALTVNLPSSPANNDCVFIKFTQNVTTVTYGNGTVVDGITAPTAGGLTVLTYDSGTTSWY